MNGKTRKVAGMDLNADCFLYTPDLANAASWLFPVLLRGDEDKTRNLIVMHLHRFDVMTEGMACELRQELFDMLRGCAITHGLHADRRVFAAKTVDTTPAPSAERTSPVPVTGKTPDVTDPAIKEAVALADRRADELLRSLGLS